MSRCRSVGVQGYAGPSWLTCQPWVRYLRPYVSELIRTAGTLLETDNEPNAVICLRIIFELHKNYRPMLQNEVLAASPLVLAARVQLPVMPTVVQVQPFLDYVQKIYRELPTTMQKLLGAPQGQVGMAPMQVSPRSARPTTVTMVLHSITIVATSRL